MDARRTQYFWAQRLALEARLACAVPGDTLRLCIKASGECPTKTCPSCLEVKVRPKLTPADVAADIEQILALR